MNVGMHKRVETDQTENKIIYLKVEAWVALNKQMKLKLIR